MPKNIPPVRKAMCATCPFRHHGPRESPGLQELLVQRASICHSTGLSVFYGRTGRPEKICRGARDVQLKLFVALGLLKKPTDACWQAKAKELNLT